MSMIKTHAKLNLQRHATGANFENAQSIPDITSIIAISLLCLRSWGWQGQNKEQSVSMIKTCAKLNLQRHAAVAYHEHHGAYIAKGHAFLNLSAWVSVSRWLQNETGSWKMPMHVRVQQLQADSTTQPEVIRIESWPATGNNVPGESPLHDLLWADKVRSVDRQIDRYDSLDQAKHYWIFRCTTETFGLRFQGIENQTPLCRYVAQA